MGYHKNVCGLSSRPMNSTEVTKIGLDNVYPGLRILDMCHPPNSTYPDASFKQIATIKNAGMTPLIKKRKI